MPTTIGQACDRAARFVHWNKPENWPFEFDRVIAANEVGEWLVNCEPWNWLLRPSALLGLTSGQGYIALPSDFGRIVSLTWVRGSGYVICLEGQQAVDEARAGLIGGTLYKAAILHSAPTSSAAPVARLELGPVPTITKTDVFRLSYYAGWRTCSSENDVVPVPAWLVGLYVRALALYMAGWERDDDGTLEERLGQLRLSSLYQQAVDRDDTLQTDLGPVRGSAEDQITGGTGESFFSDQSNPTIFS